MAQVNDLYIKLDTLKVLVDTLEKKGAKGIALTIGINDEVNNYNQNVVATIKQSKEEREAKKPKYYVGNGQTVWSNNDSFMPPREERSGATGGNNDDTDQLPF